MRERGKSAVRRLVTPLVKLIACRGENIVDGFEIELLADERLIPLSQGAPYDV